MLQQTVVATVIPYFKEFVRRWPDINALAAADEDDVLKAWAGLGYYARARNMIKAAQEISTACEGQFPQTADELIKLPGIGPYTAGAIAAIAFAQPAVVLDGNIERVLIRFAGIDQPQKRVKDRLTEGYLSVLPETRRSDFPQALMDIGAGVCTPKRAKCDICPLAIGCSARRRPNPEDLPLKPAKTAKPVRQGEIYVITGPDNQILTTRRAPTGLLGGMMGLPSSGWDKSNQDQCLLAAIADVRKNRIPQGFSHIFTHFRADIEIFHIQVSASWQPPENYSWADISPDDWPTLFRKAWQQTESFLEFDGETKSRGFNG
jgi:A/G-specific adenine glycosylase